VTTRNCWSAAAPWRLLAGAGPTTNLSAWTVSSRSVLTYNLVFQISVSDIAHRQLCTYVRSLSSELWFSLLYWHIITSCHQNTAIPFVTCLLASLISGAQSERTNTDMKNVVFWVVTPCGSCTNRRFEKPSASIIRMTRLRISSQHPSVASYG
jgi:hypothetical protein